jgi:hypothetical protein
VDHELPHCAQAVDEFGNPRFHRESRAAHRCCSDRSGVRKPHGESRVRLSSVWRRV